MSKDDLKDRLRGFEGSDGLGDGDFTVCHEAADRIERLEKRVEELDAECERAWAAYRIAFDQACANGEAAIDKELEG